MMYRSDGSATFVGLERVVGRVAGTSAVGHGTEHPLTLNYELG
jgi:hypothetical protein